MNSINGIKFLKRSDFSDVLGFLILFLKRFLKPGFFCIFFHSVSIWLYGIVSSQIVEELINSVTSANLAFETKGAFFWVIIYAVCFFTSEICNYYGKYFCIAFIPQVELKVRIAIIWYVHNLEISYFQNIDAGVMENIIDNAAEGSRECLEDIFIDIIPSVIFIIFSSIYVFFVGIQFGLVYILVLMIYITIYIALLKNVLNKGRKLFKTVNERTGKTVEIIQNFKLTKVFHLEDYATEKVFDISQSEKLLLQNYLKDIAKIGFLSACILVALNCFIMLYIVYSMKNGSKFTPGKVIGILNVLVNNSMYLWSASKQVVDILQNIAKIKQSLTRLHNSPESSIDGKKTNVKIDHIEIKNLTFKYGDRVIFKKFSCSIPKNSKICIMGPSGSGKSTLLNILAKMIPVDRNMVFVNDHDINDIDPKFFRENISYITQSNFMYHDSIYNNIALGKLNAKKEEVIEAAKKANIHEFISRLDNQYDSDVGASSNLLSGGQIQRICIARALINDCNLILCDEATSSLDGITSVKIINNILEISKAKTFIGVDHSGLFAPYMDFIILFKTNGEIVMATHEELKSRVEEYRNLFL